MSDADTVFAIAAAMEAAVGHAKSRRDLASILWAATVAMMGTSHQRLLLPATSQHLTLRQCFLL